MHQLNDLERKWRIFAFVVLFKFYTEAMTNKPASPLLFGVSGEFMKDAHDW